MDENGPSRIAGFSHRIQYVEADGGISESNAGEYLFMLSCLNSGESSDAFLCFSLVSRSINETKANASKTPLDRGLLHKKEGNLFIHEVLNKSFCTC